MTPMLPSSLKLFKANLGYNMQTLIKFGNVFTLKNQAIDFDKMFYNVREQLRMRKKGTVMKCYFI